MSSSETEDEADDEAATMVSKSVALETTGKGRDLIIINLNIILYFYFSAGLGSTLEVHVMEMAPLP